jgi:hypothetical protein
VRPGPVSTTSLVRGDPYRDQHPCDPAAVPFGLEWTEAWGHRVHRVRVARHGGTITHPWCRTFQEEGTCHHLERAVRWAEEPTVEVIRDLMADWQEAGRGEDREEWSVHAYRQMELALRLEEERRRWVEYRATAPAPPAHPEVVSADDYLSSLGGLT